MFSITEQTATLAHINVRTERHGEEPAFAGREFHIQIDDGTTFHCQGQVWSSGHGGHVSEPTVEVGIATQEELAKCYVFFGGTVSAAKLQAWLDSNTPSGNYRKYDRKHTVEWLDSVYTSGTRPICAKRAPVAPPRRAHLHGRDRPP